MHRGYNLQTRKKTVHAWDPGVETENIDSLRKLLHAHHRFMYWKSQGIERAMQLNNSSNN